MGQSQAINRVYGDYNATSPLRPAAYDAMQRAMRQHGNPSSIHQEGRAARRILEDARSSLLHELNLPDYKLVFTSGATEALSTVLATRTKTVAGQAATHLLINQSEHVAALDGHAFDASQVQTLPVTEQGLVRVETLEAILSTLPDEATALVCIQAANNETGVLQPLGAIESLCQDHGALWVCDLVQWAGRLPLGASRPDIVIVSAHKMGGPAGIGALVYNPSRVQLEQPLIRGGGQERGQRGGTENLVGAAGFAAALHDAVDHMLEERARLADLRDRFEAALVAEVPDAVIFGQATDRLPNTSCFALPHQEASLTLMQLDLAGLSISSGSACSSGKVRKSHVLQAMGVPDLIAEGALRVSFGFDSQDSDGQRLASAIASLHVPNKSKDASMDKKFAGKLQELDDQALVFSRSRSI